MAVDFPWPVTDDELLLNETLTGVLDAYDAERSSQEEYLVVEAAANLIIEAYNQGIRDRDVLAHYALKALRSGAIHRQRTNASKPA